MGCISRTDGALDLLHVAAVRVEQGICRHDDNAVRCRDFSPLEHLDTWRQRVETHDLSGCRRGRLAARQASDCCQRQQLEGFHGGVVGLRCEVRGVHGWRRFCTTPTKP